MNAALILSGGSGTRFQSDVPKQYHKLRGKMVIEYVMEAAENAQSVDRLLVAATLPCAYLDETRATHDFTLIEGGACRNESLYNGIRWLNAHDCGKLIVLDAVRPLVTARQIDAYFEFLDEGYDAVSTSQPITDSLGCLDLHAVDRSRYYLMQSPEAFRFPLLSNHFKADSRWTEVIHQLPPETRVKRCFDYPNNPKLTYPWEISALENALQLTEK